jgi:hypothetical protein
MFCFYKYHDEPDQVVRVIGPRNSRFEATDNYPGPPLVTGKILGSVRCPSYSRAVRGLHGDRSPPPEYKLNKPEILLDTVRTAITDSFTSWFSIALSPNEVVSHFVDESPNDNDDEATEQQQQRVPTYRIV